ncbi:DUF6461 domain-containing protein [Streptomyces sp. NPDC001435]|uniref:DUF6461 domain-containing protein n=1 Tax=unclassified Streptomyces TaxID=2593676 RepID=UPI00368E0C70
MTTTAADYRWFEEGFPDLAEAYQFALVRHVTPGGLLRRMGGRAEEAHTGVNAVSEAALDLLRRSGRRRQLVAMTSFGAWTLMIEPNGYGQVTEATALKVSTGTQWVSHFSDIHGDIGFLWADDGTTRLWFDPALPEQRSGTHPDELLPVMHAIGFSLGTEPTDLDLSMAATFALAEYLTGVRLHPDLLRNTTFTCGSIAVF